MAILYSGGMLDTVALCRHGGARPPPPRFSYLEVSVPAAICKIAIVSRSAGYACPCPISSTTFFLRRHFLRTTTAMAK